MAIARNPVFKRCRYLGLNPSVLGYTHKPSVRQQVRSRRKSSEYALQLKEKQKVRFVYGVLERQFQRAYARAERKSGMTGENLLRIMEQRLDNVVYRLGWAATRRQARQMVNHGHIWVNGKRVDIPSYEVSLQDVITATKKTQGVHRLIPAWLSLQKETSEATVVGFPTRSDIDFTVSERAIVELYSK
jgi:small subunit ribosomal protein S4